MRKDNVMGLIASEHKTKDEAQCPPIVNSIPREDLVHPEV